MAMTFIVGTGNFQPGGECQGAPVRGVQGVEIHVDGHAGRAADAGHQGHFIFFQAKVINGADEGAHDNTDPASGTPDGWEFLVLA